MKDKGIGPFASCSYTLLETNCLYSYKYEVS